jgi:hypothetical protein
MTHLLHAKWRRGCGSEQVHVNPFPAVSLSPTELIYFQSKVGLVKCLRDNNAFQPLTPQSSQTTFPRLINKLTGPLKTRRARAEQVQIMQMSLGKRSSRSNTIGAEFVQRFASLVRRNSFKFAFEF